MSEERAEYTTQKLTLEQAAEILSQPVYTIRRHIKAGRLPAEKILQHKQGSAPYRWEVKAEDVMKLKQELEQGQGVKLGRPPSEKSLKRGTDYTYIYHPRSDEYASWLAGILGPEERAAILDYFARRKEADPEKFQRMFKEMRLGE